MPTLNLQVGASGDDGHFGISPNVYYNAAALNSLCGNVGGAFASWYRFTGVSGLSGATIDSAVLELWDRAADVGSPQTIIKAEKAAAPTAPTSQADAEGRTLTTAGVSWNSPALSTSAFKSSPSLVSVIQELANSYDPSAIVIYWRDNGSASSNYAQSTGWDDVAARAAKLTITYTPKAGARRALLGVGR